MIGRNLDGGDPARVFDKMRDEGSLRSGRASFSLAEGKGGGGMGASTGYANWDMGTEFEEGLSVSVEIHSLEELLDRGIVPLCRVVSTTCRGRGGGTNRKC